MSQNTFLSRVFLWMGLGLFVTSLVTVVALREAQENVRFAVALNQWAFFIFLLQLFLAAGIANVYRKTTTAVTAVMYLGFCALMGLWLAPVMQMYSLEAVVGALVATVITFIVVAVYALFTKRDLTNWGAVGIMGLLAIIVVSFFVLLIIRLNPTLAYTVSWMITYTGVILFILLLGFNMQNLKKLAQNLGVATTNPNSLAVVGAFDLYLNVINLFLYLLRIMGRR